MSGASVGSEARKVLYAATGSGPLLQRDYSGVIVGATCSPEGLAKLVRERFVEFAPPETAAFEHPGGKGVPLQIGDDLTIRLGGFMPCQVRVVHMGDLSVTLRTLGGHPEAGRITFKAAWDDEQRLIFQIRSRARAGGLVHYLGFLLLGRTMQARCWVRFIGRVAEVCGGRLAGPVRVKTARIEQESGDCGGPDLPTFACDPGA